MELEILKFLEDYLMVNHEYLDEEEFEKVTRLIKYQKEKLKMSK